MIACAKAQPDEVHASDAEGGFAMVEAVAALLITSLLFVMLTVAASFVLSGSVRSLERINQAEMLHGGLDAWQREVAQAANPNAMALSLEAALEPVFEGRTDGIRFVAASRGLDRPLEVVAFEAREGSLRRRSAILSNASRLEVPSDQPETALLDGAFDYRFSYRGRSADEAWQDAWADPQVLPGFVRLSITDRVTGEAVTSAIAVVAVNAVGACQTDPCDGGGDGEELQAWSNADVSR
jgi:hypothetical protein